MAGRRRVGEAEFRFASLAVRRIPNAMVPLLTAWVTSKPAHKPPPMSPSANKTPSIAGRVFHVIVVGSQLVSLIA